MSGRPTVGALFAGYGGLELAVREVWPDAHPAWVSEFDAAPSRILAHRWPDVPNHGDITKVKWTPDCPVCGRLTALYWVGDDAHRAYWCHEHGEFPLSLRDEEMARTGVPVAEPVDIITGGSPCQDLSHAGKRAGMKAGTRSGLWASMCDAIETIRPSLVIWENVRGALTAEGEPPTLEILELEDVAARTRRALVTVERRLGRATRKGQPAHVQYHRRDSVRLLRRFNREVGAVRRERAGLVRALGRVVGDLAELGYDAAWTGLRAADVGAPHGRWRVFVLAWPQSEPGALTWPQSEPGALLPTPTVSEANGAGEHGMGGQDLRTVASLLPTPTTAPTTGNGHARNLGAEARTLLPTPRATDGTKGGPNQRGSSGDLMLPSAVTLLPTPTSMDSRSSGATYAPTDTHHTGTTLTDATVRQADRFGIYAPAIARWEALTRPAPAPTEPTGRDGAHRLSPAFVEWLMGLPAGWVTGVPSISRNDQLKALGSGVVPQQAATAIRHLLAIRNDALRSAAA